MFDDQMAKQAEVAQGGMIGAYIRPTRRKRLQDKRSQLQAALATVDAAIAALDAHPELEEFAEALSRAGE